MRVASKASLYRREITRAAIGAMLATVERVESSAFRPEPLNYDDPAVRGNAASDHEAARSRDQLEAGQCRRRSCSKIHAGDSAPGVVDVIEARNTTSMARMRKAVLRGGHSRPDHRQAPRRHLPRCHRRRRLDLASEEEERRSGAVSAAPALEAQGASGTSSCRRPWCSATRSPRRRRRRSSSLHRDVTPTFKEIWYEEEASVGYLHFDFHNGAMSTDQCRRLREAYLAALQRPDQGRRADGRHGFLVERHPSQRDRGGGQSRRRVVAQHQRHRRRGERDHHDVQPSHRLGGLGRRWRRRRDHAACGRRGLGARGRRDESALQDYGALWLRILDLSATPTGGAGARAGAHRATAPHRHEEGESHRHDRRDSFRRLRALSRAGARAGGGARGERGFRGAP